MIINNNDYVPDFNLSVVKKGKKQFLKVFMCLDTETSHNHDDINPVGWIYQWAIQIEEFTVVGRTPTELITFLQRISEYIGTNKMLVFVHNLSYDICYMFDWLIQAFGEPEYLCTKPHKFIFARFGNFEFRCTYFLSNRSLDKWSKDLNTQHRKLVDTIDYYAIHYQDEELTKTDWEYMAHDVIVLQECVLSQLKLYKDNLASLPLTSTGYIRRETRRNYRKDNRNRKNFLRTSMSSKVYGLLLREFQGAITHGNRFRVEETVTGTIKHRDFRSHYPSQQRVRKFPVGKFRLYDSDLTLEELVNLSKDFCTLSLITFECLQLKDRKTTIPYLNVDKCVKGKIDGIPQHIIKDNGRVLVLKGYTQLVVTEIDLELILKQYNFQSYKIHEVYYSERGFLPKFMIETVDEFMLGKTKFKELAKHETDTDKKIDYTQSLMKSKNGLNGIYGATAQKPVQSEIKIDLETGEFLPETQITEKFIDEQLEKYYNNRQSYNRYCWGCWTTAWARWELIRFCELIGYENILYCDTDSAFYLSTPEIEKRIEEENTRMKEYALSIGAYINYNDKIVHYDCFEEEEENITHFRFLHAKCYAYITDNTDLHLTIAGVQAKESPTSKITREIELGSIDNLESGFVFKKCGGTTSAYFNQKPFTYDHNGHILECASSCIINQTTKTLHNEIDRFDDWWEWDIV